MIGAPLFDFTQPQDHAHHAVVSSLQWGLSKARQERDAEVVEADNLFNELQRSRQDQLVSQLIQ